MTAIVNQPESITKTTAPNVNTEDKNDLPEGLKELNQLNEITIHECLGKADMCFQRPCRYTVHAEGADVDDHFLYIQEDLNPLHIQDKVIILGASFLIDFNFFEGQQRTCC
ncbi:hypothetical protein KUTeg_006389 [Tegillarca granosa]|uniref:Uncharacterized protein n=1 Tax=Tegillarca granosa TaxID=220873 RepID=A0ABQ9FJB8_TEGGR|nr:hypothetical protein KUTeg_006389 [Tegillarca granosa]